MRELSMHILDLAQNSIAAGATRLGIEVTAYPPMFRDFGSIRSAISDEIEIPKHREDFGSIRSAESDEIEIPKHRTDFGSIRSAESDEIEILKHRGDFGSTQSAESDEIEIPKHRTDALIITIRDNGKGMSEEFLARVKDPFTTTRTVRRVGLGIPMFTEAAQACDGDVTVESKPGNGTTVTAWFKLSHIDRAPLGDMAATLVSIIAANPEMSVRYTQRVDDSEFVLDTDKIKSQLDGVPINEGPVLKWIGEYVREQTSGALAVV